MGKSLLCLGSRQMAACHPVYSFVSFCHSLPAGQPRHCCAAQLAKCTPKLLRVLDPVHLISTAISLTLLVRSSVCARNLTLASCDFAFFMSRSQLGSDSVSSLRRSTAGIWWWQADSVATGVRRGERQGVRWEWDSHIRKAPSTG